MKSIHGAGVVLVALAALSQAGETDLFLVPGLTGRPGGTLVFAQRSEPLTLNPLIAKDGASREVIPRLMADLIHINRYTLKTEPALAKSWTISPDGRRFVMELRRGVSFSDGQPFDADDVLFTFRAYLDDKVNSVQRDQLILNGKPIVVRKLDQFRVSFELPEANAVAERLFDGFYILPRHLLEGLLDREKLNEAWGLRSAPSEIAGLGPFRLKEYAAGQRLVLERNPYYWKKDAAGTQLPYLAELRFVFAGTEDGQVLRFQSGESDLISRFSARNYSVLLRDAPKRGYRLARLNGGMEYSLLVFNLNDPSRVPARTAARVPFLRRESLRKAVSLAIDREAMVRLVYGGMATPIAIPVPPGNRPWINENLPPPARNVAGARQILARDGFKWQRDGRLLDPHGMPVEFTIAFSSGNPERQPMAALIQEDLRALGITVQVAPLEYRSLSDRIGRSFDYDAAILSLSSPDADPNADINVWLSSGGAHLWHPNQKAPSTPWEAEIDNLMRRQAVARDPVLRKKLFDRVQEIFAGQLPMIPLVSPFVLAGARKGLENFRPAVLEHSTLWNVEELCWGPPDGVRR